MSGPTLSQAEIDALFAQASDGSTPDIAPAATAPEPAAEVAAAPAAPRPKAEPDWEADVALPPDVDKTVASEPKAEAPVTAAFPTLEPSEAEWTEPVSIGLLADVDLEVTVRLGETVRNIREILEMAPGQVLTLDRLAGEAVDLLVNGRAVARAEVVVIGQNYGVRITELLQPENEAGV